MYCQWDDEYEYDRVKEDMNILIPFLRICMLKCIQKYKTVSIWDTLSLSFTLAYFISFLVLSIIRNELIYLLI